MQAIFIGDEATAAGYRLAGFEVRTPPRDEAPACLRDALVSGAPLVLITMEYLESIEETERDELLARVRPPVLPVTDAAGHVLVPDLADWIRKGILA